jgi:hypothetical protein
MQISEDKKVGINYKGFWRWCVTLIATGFPDDGQSPETR